MQTTERTMELEAKKERANSKLSKLNKHRLRSTFAMPDATWKEEQECAIREYIKQQVKSAKCRTHKCTNAQTHKCTNAQMLKQIPIPNSTHPLENKCTLHESAEVPRPSNCPSDAEKDGISAVPPPLPLPLPQPLPMPIPMPVGLSSTRTVLPGCSTGFRAGAHCERACGGMVTTQHNTVHTVPLNHHGHRSIG